MRERRPNLATIVGSGLAAVAAGSLLAFSSLAEQAGLQGLATGRIEPAAPVRGGGDRAIRLPAPPPGAGADPVEQLIRDTFARTDVSAAAPARAPRVTPGAPPAAAPNPPSKPDKAEKTSRPRRSAPGRPSAAVAFAPREVGGETEAAEGVSGNAHGNDKAKKHKKPKGPKPAKESRGKGRHGKGHGKGKTDAGPIYARGRGATKSKDEPTTWKPVKAKKSGNAAKHPGTAGGHAKQDQAGRKGNGRGHSKHGHANGKGRGKGKGHSKHGH